MFDRVSTIDLGTFVTPNRPLNELGIGIGKKFDGDYTLRYGDETPQYPDTELFVSANVGLAGGYPIYIQTVNGFIKRDDSYPDYYVPEIDESYKLPDNLPPFVNANKRGLIGGGTSSFGPFKLQEAVYFYSVVKSLKFKQGSWPTVTVNSPNGSVTSVGNEVETSYFSVSDPENNPNPSKLFWQYSKKYNQVVAFQKRTNLGSYPDTSSGQAGFELKPQRLGFTNSQVGIGSLDILVDVDNLNDYYVVGQSLGVYLKVTSYASAASTGEYDLTRPDGSTRPDYPITSTKFYQKEYLMSMAKERFVVPSSGSYTGVTILSNVGDSVSFDPYPYQTDGEREQSYKYVERDLTITYKYLGVLKRLEKKLYGVEAINDFTYVGGYLGQTHPAPSVSINISNLNVNLDVEEYWPYKNANGQPVYNTTTGAIINPPIP